MAFLLFVMTMSFCSLWLQFGSCAPAPEMLPTSLASGQVLATLDPFTNSLDNISLTLFLRSDNYLSLASLRRSQAHRYDINTTADFCEIDVGTVGVWNWRSGCAQISVGNSCSATLSKEGDLQVLDGSSVAWSSHTAGKNVQLVELLNSGDLLLINSSNAIIWRSSDNIVKEVCVAEAPSGAPTTTSPGAASSPSPEGHTMPSSSPSTSEGPAKGSTTSAPSGPKGPKGSTSSAPSGPEASAEGPSQASHSSASRLSVSRLKNSLTSQIIAILLSGGCTILFLM